jgi:hypothetical protein
MNFKYYKPEKLILIIIGLTVIFGGISMFIHHTIAGLPEVPQYLILFTDSFTVPFFIGITLHFINKKWWKYKNFAWLVNIPDLNGRYVGKLVSSYIIEGTTDNVILDCVLEIKQTASSIHISGYFGKIEEEYISSSSNSVSEEIVLERNGFFKLFYIFTNEPGGISDQLNNHIGTAKFSYLPDKKTLDGIYYNLKNHGTINVTYSQATLLGRLTP